MVDILIALVCTSQVSYQERGTHLGIWPQKTKYTKCSGNETVNICRSMVAQNFGFQSCRAAASALFAARKSWRASGPSHQSVNREQHLKLIKIAYFFK